MKPLRVENKRFSYPFQLIYWVLIGSLFCMSVDLDYFNYFMVFFLIISFLFQNWLSFGPIEMSEEYICMATHFKKFGMNWDEVKSIALVGEGPKKIILSNSKKTLTIPGFDSWRGEDKAAMIELFNRQIKERQIQISQMRFFPLIINQGVELKKSKSTAKQKISGVRYSMKHNWRSMLLLPLVLVVVIVLSKALQSGLPMTIFVISSCLVMLTGRIEINDEVIRLLYYSTHELRWDEVERVEMPAAHSREMVFYGQDKVLAIAGPDWWQGEDKEAMIEVCNRQIETREIPLVRELGFKRHRTTKNTRVSPDQ